MGKDKHITYDMRVEYAEKMFDKHFKNTFKYPEFKAIYDFGTDRDRKILDFAYTIAKSEFLWGYTTAQSMDEQIKRAYSTTDQVQE